jgi:hypothetical protein
MAPNHPLPKQKALCPESTTLFTTQMSRPPKARPPACGNTHHETRACAKIENRLSLLVFSDKQQRRKHWIGVQSYYIIDNIDCQ